jgi:hypothetical protein
MKFRKLRIAFSIVCAIACVLLIALWVHSSLSDHHDNMSWFFEGQRSYRPRVEQISSGYVLMIPFWLPVLVTGALATALVPSFVLSLPSWLLALVNLARTGFSRISVPRRFSLRTLLIATTLVAVVLGVVVYATRY